MKAPHLMSSTERRESLEVRRENAEYLAVTYAQMARHNPKTYFPLANGWRKEALRLKEILK